MSNPGENFRAVRPHHRADICITREKITTSFSYMGHNIQQEASRPNSSAT